MKYVALSLMLVCLLLATSAAWAIHTHQGGTLTDRGVDSYGPAVIAIDGKDGLRNALCYDGTYGGDPSCETPSTAAKRLMAHFGVSFRTLLCAPYAMGCWDRSVNRYTWCWDSACGDYNTFQRLVAGEKIIFLYGTALMIGDCLNPLQRCWPTCPPAHTTPTVEVKPPCGEKPIITEKTTNNYYYRQVAISRRSPPALGEGRVPAFIQNDGAYLEKEKSAAGLIVAPVNNNKVEHHEHHENPPCNNPGDLHSGPGPGDVP